MSQLLQDVGQSVRSLRKSPGFVAAAVIVMALGIGANTAIFSVVNAVLIRPLPYSDPSRLMFVWHVPPARSFPGITRFAVSPANYFDWKAMNSVFQDSAIFGYESFTRTGLDRPETIAGSKVEISFFRTLGVEPMLGRTFLPGEDQPGREHVVVLSHALWKERFASDPSIVGRTIQFDDEPYTVIGVMPGRVALPRFAQVWTPLAMTSQERAVRANHNYMVIARLKPGVTLQQANADLTAISNKLQQAYPADDAGWGSVVIAMREDAVAHLRTALFVLLGAVTFVLLIACANVANLLLARTLERQREMAIRMALGASRARLMRKVMSESVIVSLAGGLVGLIVASFGIRLIVTFLSDALPRSAEIKLDPSVLLFTFAISVLTGVLAGIVPAWRFASGNANEALKEGSTRSTEHRGNRIRSALIVAEVAVSLLLVVGAGLMIRTLWNLQHTDAGFDAGHTLSMLVAAPAKEYSSHLQHREAMDAVLNRVQTVPGVQGAGMIDSLPLMGGSQQPVQAEGQPVVPMADQPEVAVRVITPGYMRSMGIPLLKGRDISETDSESAPGAVLISESMAKRIWPNQDPIGKHLTLYFSPQRTRQVVGVVGDVKQGEMSAQEDMATLYNPLAQDDPDPDRKQFRPRAMYMVVRTSGNPAALGSTVVNAIHEVNRNIPVLEILPMQDYIAETLTPERMNMALLVSFAGLAIVLASVGIYSVLAYTVRRRVREIGIRMALGAQLQDITKMIILRTIRPVAVGIVLGLLLSLLVGRTLRSMVYGVRPTDVLTLLSGCALMLLVALLASLLPAFRATQVVPVEILREE